MYFSLKNQTKASQLSDGVVQGFCLKHSIETARSDENGRAFAVAADILKK